MFSTPLRDIAVTYARPFSINKGDEIRKHQLSVKTHVPKSSRKFHDELIRLRMEQLAHTDLKFYSPKVAKFYGTAKPWFPMSFKSYDYENLLSQISEIEKLVRDVEHSVQSELSHYETTF